MFEVNSSYCVKFKVPLSRSTMLINEHEKIVGERCVLVPYERYHVPKYHNWMQDEELLASTSSERLTLDEEYAMQETWRVDSTKLTFIILHRPTYEQSGGNEIEAMAGDINGFIINEDSSPDDDSCDHYTEDAMELSVMIAEKRFRGSGMASEAVTLMIRYAHERLHIDRFVAKIDAGNEASFALFRKLHFKETRVDAVFNCHTYSVDFSRFLDEIQEKIQLYTV